jgi:cytoskeleton protein RodZ
MTAIGETLRQERLRRNLGLQQISNELKLSKRFLEAIEAEQFDRLPGGVFTRSFVRQYARYLGLDGEELAAEVARLAEPPAEEGFPLDSKAQLAGADIPLPAAAAWDRISDGFRFRWPRWLPGLGLVVVMTLACSGAYIWWQRAERAAAHAAQRPAPPPQVAPAAPAASAPAPDLAAPPATTGTASNQAPAPQLPIATPASPSPALSTAAAATLQPVASSRSGAPAGDAAARLHVELTAREMVWVRASSNGAFLFSVTMAPNSTRTVDATGSLELRLGNAGGVDISLNGKSIGPAGPKGQVRTVQLTSGGFNIVAPSKPAPADPL